MSEFQKQEGNQHPTDCDPRMDDQLLKLEQELQRFVPASRTTNPDAMMSYVWSATRQDASHPVIESGDASDVVDSRVDLAKAVDRKRWHWVGAMAGSWLAGMIAGALAMWAVTTGWTGGPGERSPSLKAELVKAPLNQNDLQLVQPSTTQIVSTEKASPVGIDQSIELGLNASSQRNFDVDDVMANTQLTVFTAKHVQHPNDQWGDPGLGTSYDFEAGASAEPSTRNNLMKSLVF